MEKLINITNLVFLIILGIITLSYIYKVYFWIVGLKKQKFFPKAKVNRKYAIVVPARFESKVIRGLLDSVTKQTYNNEFIDTFVIVPDSTDESIEICKQYQNTHSYILNRKVKSKGETLDEFFKSLISNNKNVYDGYFIIDADNILENNFVELMNDAFDTNKYDIVLGARSNKNFKDGWVSNCTFLTFSLVNGLNNKARTKLGGNVTISGSGVLISKSIIEENNGWPWQSLTEDYEITQVSLLKDYKSCYYEHARVYDEQPKTLKQSKIQRLRWLKGHSNVDKMYSSKIRKKAFSKKTKNRLIYLDYIWCLIPPVAVIVVFTLFFICNLVYVFVGLSLNSPFYLKAILYASITLVSIILLLQIYSIMGLIADRVNVKMNKRYLITTVLMSPIFYLSYVTIFVKSLFLKQVKWEVTKHTKCTVDKVK